LPFPLLSDASAQVARLYKARDTFEDLPLHGVVLVDREQKIRWSRLGAEPFTDLGFLKSEIDRVSRMLGGEERSF
jgi:alkyl hydroperoxide reductase subunit AhpC